jgi:hypothetical protein
MSPKSSISSPMSPGVPPPRLASRALAATHARAPEQASGIREEDEGGDGQGGLRLVRRRRRAAEGGGGGGGAWERSESDQSMCGEYATAYLIFIEGLV